MRKYLCKCYVFATQGPAAAADLLQGIEGEYLGNEQTPQNNKYEVHKLLCNIHSTLSDEILW